MEGLRNHFPAQTHTYTHYHPINLSSGEILSNLVAVGKQPGDSGVPGRRLRCEDTGDYGD